MAQREVRAGEAAGDMLYVSDKGTSFIRDFEGSAGFILDFRMAQNLGLIDVTLGDGNNKIFGSRKISKFNDQRNIRQKIK